MSRRSSDQAGWVVFPTDVPSSNEGGMAVYVVVPVEDSDEPGSLQAQCCGTTSVLMLRNEVLLPSPDVPGSYDYGWVLSDGTRVPLSSMPTAEIDKAAARFTAEGRPPVGHFDEPPPTEALLFPRASEVHSSVLGTFDQLEHLESLMSTPLYAALLLGASGLSPSYASEPDSVGPDGECYWRARREDLTPDGLALVELLEKLYGRPAILLTFLDT